jgi:protein-disulfide isomerase
MKRTIILLVLAFLFVAGWAFLPCAVQADLEWKVIKALDLKATPLDVTPSVDGKWLFILTSGEILVYSFPDGRITDRIPVDKHFDRIASLPRANLVTISSSAKKALQIILIEAVYKIDMTDLPFKGPQNALVTVVVFDDYQCPYCAGLEPLLRQVLEKYPNDVKLVVKQFPLPMHGYARKAATAALAAGKQGKFWEIHEKLFTNQNDLTDARVAAIAQEIGLNIEQFNKDLKDPAIASLIDRDIKNGREANVQATPTIFVSGKLLNQRSLQGFQQAIDAKLKEKNRRQYQQFSRFAE